MVTSALYDTVLLCVRMAYIIRFEKSNCDFKKYSTKCISTCGGSHQPSAAFSKVALTVLEYVKSNVGIRLKLNTADQSSWNVGKSCCVPNKIVAKCNNLF